MVVEPLSGDPSRLLNCTLFQDAYPNYGITKAFAPIADIEKITDDQKEFYQFLLMYSQQL